MKIAIVGTGISGLTAAYVLHGTHDVTLFEAGTHVGGHVCTVDVELDGRTVAVDAGFIVYNERTYPNFTRLLEELRVPTRPTTMSFSVRCDRSGLEYSGSTLDGLFAQRRNALRPAFLRMLSDVLRFHREAPRILDEAHERLTVGEYLERGRYGRWFAEKYLLPMGSAIWSCPTGAFAEFPLRFVVEFYRNHGLLQLRDRPTWRVVEGGSRNYVAAMTAGFRDRIRLGTPVLSVRRDVDAFGETESVTIRATGREAERFDRVIFACHSDQALALLADPTPTERDVLSRFPYERNVALLHTDAAVLPRSRRAWSSWNYRLPRDDSSRATVTYLLNVLQGIASSEAICVTLNDDGTIDPQRIRKRIVFEHPVFTTERAAAQRRHGELLAANRTSYCGAYWRNGFHEDGMQSALRVCRALGARTDRWTIDWPAESTSEPSGTRDVVPSVTSFDTACS